MGHNAFHGGKRSSHIGHSTVHRGYKAHVGAVIDRMQIGDSFSSDFDSKPGSMSRIAGTYLKDTRTRSMQATRQMGSYIAGAYDNYPTGFHDSMCTFSHSNLSGSTGRRCSSLWPTVTMHSTVRFSGIPKVSRTMSSAGVPSAVNRLRT